MDLRAADVELKIPSDTSKCELSSPKSVLSSKLGGISQVRRNVLIIEPYYGGSHQQFLNELLKGLRVKLKMSLYVLPAKKWHWRARTSALFFYETVPRDKDYDVIFASSVLNLAEFIALRPDLSSCHKILYFHENQLTYPVQQVKERDFQYGYNQILSCLVADRIVFNSYYNMTSFLGNLDTFFKLQPDHRPRNLRDSIEPKCQVIYLPVNFPPSLPMATEGPLHIIWPHRWEHDKNPGMFFSAIRSLKDRGHKFFISVLGRTNEDHPKIFSEVKDHLKDHIKVWGFVESKDEYWKTLLESDVAVSTADHEFFGISMLEAAASGCLPLCPNKLVYPELYPSMCMYSGERALVDKLEEFCLEPRKARLIVTGLDFDLKRFRSADIIPKYEGLFSGSK